MPERRSLIGVIGGGISGLAAADRLQRSGAQPILYEKAPRVGGKVVTEEIDGFLIEGGPDSFVVGKASVMDLAADLGLAEQVIPMRSQGAQVWSRGKFHPLPRGLRPFLRSSLLSTRGKLRVAGDLVLPRRAGASDESLESFVTRRLGREVLEKVAEPLIAGIHAGEPASMSVQASFPRLVAMEREHRSLLLALRANRRRALAGPGHFASLQRGMGQLTAALEKSLKICELRTNTAVIGLDRVGGGYRLALGDEPSVEVDGVVVAVPAEESARLLAPLLPAAAAILGGIGQVATATVTFAYRSESLPPLPGSGFVIPAVEGRRIMGVSYLSNKWAGRVPDDRWQLVRAFVGGAHGQELATAEEAQLIAVVREELSDLLGVGADPHLTRVHSWRKGLHQYQLGHAERVAGVERALAAHPGLGLAGAALYGIGLNECVSSGQRAADSVLAAVRRSVAVG